MNSGVGEKRSRDDESSSDAMISSRQRLDQDGDEAHPQQHLPPPAQAAETDETLLSSESDNNKSKKAMTERDERRLEINRLRAKDMRKRKKKMIEDMQQQILNLTTENNRLRIECQIQNAELAFWRNNNPSMQQQAQLFSRSVGMGQAGQQQQQLIPNHIGQIQRLQGDNIARDQMAMMQPQANAINIPGVPGDRSNLLNNFDRQQPRDNASAIAAAALRLVGEGNAGANAGRHPALANLESLAGVDAAHQMQPSTMNSPPSSLASALAEPNRALGLPSNNVAQSNLERLMPNRPDSLNQSHLASSVASPSPLDRLMPNASSSLNSNTMPASSTFDPNGHLAPGVATQAGSGPLDPNSRLVANALGAGAGPSGLDASAAMRLGVGGAQSSGNGSINNAVSNSENGSGEPKVADLQNIVARGRDINAIIREIQGQDERNRLLRDFLR